ncbi:hypothetical protein Blolo01_19200 [Bifidobacterium longum subsp. longum]|uniref:hypothetical protein n=1 Tax=Bifidobacterium longum TaxID=216816 RepID=UPI001CE3D646|nr:hypothetical protein [Bifidobacterium longum]UCH55750.1 hypothetical protein LCQ52_01760 [Bifidobacterium longum subsp. longum]GLV01622.1 hypothetical protein Blolo01_19200 [Bifidobacterium longum subsp. longum]
MNNIDANVTAWQLGPVTIMRGTATPTHKGEPPRMLRPVHRHRPVARRGDPQVLAPRRPDVRRLLGTRTTRPAGGAGVRVTEGVRRIIVEWHGKGVPPEETAQSLRIPVDEVKAIILQAHPAPPQPKRPEFLEPRYAPEKPAGIGDNRRES